MRERNITAEQLNQLANRAGLYAILDACDAPSVPPKMQVLGPQKALSLFNGAAKEDYWAVAPYLVSVDVGTLEWLRENLWKDFWGIFVLAKVSLSELHHHLRKLLTAELPDGRTWFFRYYDPRVLQQYLPICSDAELEAFYGPVQAYGVSQKENLDCLAFVRH